MILLKFYLFQNSKDIERKIVQDLSTRNVAFHVEQ